MRLPVAALAALLACAAWPAQASPNLTLDEVFDRVLDRHPKLQLFSALHERRQAELDQAGLNPPVRLGAELENALGSGQARALHGAELTLSLASVLPRGGRREARMDVARQRLGALDLQREGQRLDLLAEAARRYLVVLASREQQAIRSDAVRQRQQVLAQVRRRHAAGAVPRVDVLDARAALATAELDQAQAAQQRLAARRKLGAMWGEREPDFQLSDGGQLTVLPALAGFDELAGWLERTPEIRRFADRTRIAEARLQLARSQAYGDIEWQIGLRYLAADNDVGLVAGLSMPLGASGRAQPAIRAARAELEAVGLEREAAGLSLYATLAQAHGRYRAAQLEVSRLQEDVLPLLEQAQAEAADAYRQGAISHVQWASLLSRASQARGRLLSAAVTARRALIEIQRLTGQSFTTTREATP